LGKRGPKKGKGGRPRGSYSGPRKKDNPFRRAMRLAMREYRERKYREEARKKAERKRKRKRRGRGG